MDKSAFEKAPRDEKLWFAVVGLLLALGLAIIVGG